MIKKIQDPDDSELFRIAIGSVRPIKNDNIYFVGKEKPKPFPNQVPVTLEDRLVRHNDHGLDSVSIEDRLSFRAAGMQKNVLAKMRKGHFGLDAEIDLHGLTSGEAKRQLLSFLHRSVIDGCRSVLIIHGKGYRSEDNHPVLKNNLNLWLRQHPDVLAFCSARPRDGGTGAAIVLLKLAEKYADKDKGK